MLLEQVTAVTASVYTPRANTELLGKPPPGKQMHASASTFAFEEPHPERAPHKPCQPIIRASQHCLHSSTYLLHTPALAYYATRHHHTRWLK